MKKRIFFIWSLLLITIGSFGSNKVYQQVITEQFRNEIAGIALNDSFPSADRFGNLYPGTVAQNIINILNTDPSGVQLTKSEREYVIAIVSGLRPVWSKMKAVYGFVGGNAWKHKWNWKDMRDLDVAFRLSFLGGGWIHSATGSKPNGTTSYADTFFNPLIVFTDLNKNNNSLSLFVREGSINQNRTDFGAFQGGSVYALYNSRSVNANGGSGFEVKSNSLYSPPVTANSNLIASMLGNERFLIKNDIINLGVINIHTGSFFPGLNMYLGNISGSNSPSDGRIIFAHIGDGLTQQQAIQMSHIVTFAQGILNRQ